MKTHQWFKEKLNKFKNDPEFLREYIELLEGEIVELSKSKQCPECGLIQSKFINCPHCGFAIGF
jgi:transposase